MNTEQINSEEQRQMVRALGIDDVSADHTLNLSEMKTVLDSGLDPKFASVGEAIRNDIEGRLDADLLDEALSDLGTQIGRLPEVRTAGIPDGEREPERLYRELVEPGWRVYDHLVDVGFFESVDVNVPRFTREHIKSTAREIVRADPLTEGLTEVGYDEEELVKLVMNVTNNDLRLSRWVPTADIPEGVEFELEHVPPLHQRAAGGGLLWIRTMDVHLWQKQVLITDEILDDAFRDIKAMLAGFHLLSRAALEIADSERDSLTDSQLTAALTAGAAIMIINQEDLCRDAYYITEDVRAPSEAR
ncbi:hypothetical protein [Haladaptatus sp. CMAA 1911]|uniref:hypothetical protein n=1 Tax=unclassified Haladaptatus TaxID=2622732 RepID=UPI0037552824